MVVDSDKELLIRLEGKVDAILENMKEIPELEKRVRAVETQTVSIPEMKQDIKALEAKSDTWSVINSVGVFIAGVLGIFVQK